MNFDFNFFFVFLTCKLLGLAGEIEYPLSLVDEILPDGLVRLSLTTTLTKSALSLRLVPVAATGVTAAEAEEADADADAVGVVADVGDIRLVSSWKCESSSRTH